MLLELLEPIEPRSKTMDVFFRSLHERGVFEIDAHPEELYDTSKIWAKILSILDDLKDGQLSAIREWRKEHIDAYALAEMEKTEPNTYERYMYSDLHGIVHSIGNSGFIPAITSFRDAYPDFPNQELLTHAIEMSQKFHTVANIFFSFDDFLLDVGFEPVNNKGRFSKRVSAWAFKNYGFRLTSEHLTTLGNVHNANKYCSIVTTIGFTNNFSWDDGDFGKGDSCWWGTYSASRDTLYYYGGYGMLFFDKKQRGSGRIWVLPVSADTVFIFNAYGYAYGNFGEYSREDVELKMGAVILSSLLRDAFGGSWKYGKIEVSMYNSSIPYINGCSGIVISRDELAIYNNLDLTWMKPKQGYFEEDNTVGCYNCNERFHEGDTYYINGETYCESCRDDLFMYCERCDEWYDSDNISDVYYSEGRAGVYYTACWCDDCIRNHATECEDCNSYYSDGLDVVMEVVTITGSTSNICTTCYERGNYGSCEECKGNFEQDCLSGTESGQFCSDCLVEYIERNEENNNENAN